MVIGHLINKVAGIAALDKGHPGPCAITMGQGRAILTRACDKYAFALKIMECRVLLHAHSLWLNDFLL